MALILNEEKPLTVNFECHKKPTQPGTMPVPLCHEEDKQVQQCANNKRVPNIIPCLCLRHKVRKAEHMVHDANNYNFLPNFSPVHTWSLEGPVVANLSYSGHACEYCGDVLGEKIVRHQDDDQG